MPAAYSRRNLHLRCKRYLHLRLREAILCVAGVNRDRPRHTDGTRPVVVCDGGPPVAAGPLPASPVRHRAPVRMEPANEKSPRIPRCARPPTGLGEVERSGTRRRAAGLIPPSTNERNEMKKLLAFALAAVAIAAPATADAATLSQRVAKVEAKLACLQYAGLSEWGGYAPYAGGDGSFAYDPWIDVLGCQLRHGERPAPQRRRLPRPRPSRTRRRAGPSSGCGKSSLASWLAWQLGMPAVHLDLYNTSNHPIQWRTADLARTVSHRLDRCPVIVEGVLALDALEQIGRKPGFLIVVNGKGSDELAGQIAAYRSRQNPNAHADFTFDGYDEESPPQ